MALQKTKKKVTLRNCAKRFLERPVEKRRNKCSMAKWNECAGVSRELTLNELSWVMTADFDVPAYEPVAWADAATVAWADAPTSATKKVCRKLSNRVSANNSRMKKKLYVAELEARVLAVEQENAALRAELRAAELENSRLAAAAGELMLCLD